ncbi:ribosome hibernation promotion factor [Amycolatopsis rhizosphaerae]|uniref:ribosome hibernation promotion factor n=1 Tax=Amycolatopsis rhizosphaerae TaxID=2053003 RepID=UPI001643BA1F|nr:HPF/RaiA family ribosome-associated protein [Amycolatopsis rhizosphaerae]
MTSPQSGPASGIRVATDGNVPARAADYAREKVGAVIHLAHRPVLSARVRLSRHGDPARPRPVVAQANLDVNGRLVRAQADGESAREAIDRLEARLRHRLERAAGNWEARRGGVPSTAPHEWRHQSEPAHRPRWFPRPAGEREIVRHKAFALRVCSLDEAADDMDLLDYDFHLFTEAGTGRDSVLYRAGPTGYRLAQATSPRAGELEVFQLPVTISEQPAPVLTTEDAVSRLDLLGLPFLFFQDAERGRGAVLYHRYDGHYGLLSPADSP